MSEKENESKSEYESVTVDYRVNNGDENRGNSSDTRNGASSATDSEVTSAEFLKRKRDLDQDLEDKNEDVFKKLKSVMESIHASKYDDQTGIESVTEYMEISPEKVGQAVQMINFVMQNGPQLQGGRLNIPTGPGGAGFGPVPGGIGGVPGGGFVGGAGGYGGGGVGGFGASGNNGNLYNGYGASAPPVIETPNIPGVTFGQPSPTATGYLMVIEVPKSYIGRIIGRGGEVINLVQSKSGCKVQIDQNVPEGNPCKVNINGTLQSIPIASSMVAEILTSGPQRMLMNHGPAQQPPMAVGGGGGYYDRGMGGGPVGGGGYGMGMGGPGPNLPYGGGGGGGMYGAPGGGAMYGGPGGPVGGGMMGGYGMGGGGGGYPQDSLPYGGGGNPNVHMGAQSTMQGPSGGYAGGGGYNQQGNQGYGGGAGAAAGISNWQAPQQQHHAGGNPNQNQQHQQRSQQHAYTNPVTVSKPMAPTPAPIPAGWAEHKTDDGTSYWYNSSTGVSQ
eukprot:gene4742-6028_t